MTLESLKQLVMQQAEEKGFGTRPDQIIVSEKLILICDEALEAEEAIAKAIAISEKKSELYLSMRQGPGVDPDKVRKHTPEQMLLRYTSNHASDLMESYFHNWGDALQRILHLGGAFNVTFHEPVSRPVGKHDNPFPGYSMTCESSQKYSLQTKGLIDICILAYRDYHNMKKVPERETRFKEGLIAAAHYCLNISDIEGFDIEAAVLEKIQTNKSREWRPSDYNEKLGA